MLLVDKVRENRLRRMAKRQGMELKKSPRRDPRAGDYGGFLLLDVRNNFVLLGATPFAFSADLEAVERFLLGTQEKT